MRSAVEAGDDRGPGVILQHLKQEKLGHVIFRDINSRLKVILDVSELDHDLGIRESHILPLQYSRLLGRGPCREASAKAKGVSLSASWKLI